MNALGARHGGKSETKNRRETRAGGEETDIHGHTQRPFSEVYNRSHLYTFPTIVLTLSCLSMGERCVGNRYKAILVGIRSILVVPYLCSVLSRLV